MDFYLKLAPWKLFLILTGALVFPMVVFESTPPNRVSFFVYAVFYSVLVFGWVVSIGIEANRKLEDGLKKSPYLMLLGLIYCAVYGGISIFFLMPTSVEDLPVNLGLIFPLHFISFGCSIYSMGYSAKRLKSLQIRKIPVFSEYVSILLGFWFFPLGVWFIQPKVNRYLAEGSTSASN